MNDTQTRLLINPITKTIIPKYRNQQAVYIAKGDHKSVRIIFELPRYVDGYDMSDTKNLINIHFVNLSEDGENYSKGVSEAISREIEGDKLSFTWLVDKRATRYAGVVSVGITVEQYDNIDGKVQELYSWSTAPYNKTIVWDSHDNTAEAIEQEYDYLVQTVNALMTLALQNKLTDIDEIINNKITNAGTIIDSKTAEAKTEIDGKLINAKAEIDNGVQLTARYAQESGSNALLAKDQVTLAQSWAVGGTGYREGENTDNAKFYSAEAKRFSDTAEEMAVEAESWAHGGMRIRDDEDIDNAMYYCDKALEHAAASKSSAESAGSFAEDARTFARDVIVVKNDVWQYRMDAEAFAQQSEEYAESNILKGKISGVNAVRIDDISVIPHNIEVTTDVPTGIKTYGKNITDFTPTLTGVLNDDWDSYKTESGSTRYVRLLNIPQLTNCTMTISLGGTHEGTSALQESVDGGEWTRISYFMSDSMPYKSITFGMKPNTKYRMWGNKEGVQSISYVQVELGSTATEIEEYKEPIEGAVWIHPTATIIADTNGVNITAEYNRDINKVIANLENAMANT